ncbi:hypothetical protein [Phosphitispora fastidiosa]|uniref:hypothetical protein n=1 Tax=Phosphitispora fastidiosa TaxID=2837202 RepID=UPI001E5FB8B1|nr:hypothetical protein [Phosphitispora fastidiosa]MBU7005385.1 hypothetical protein [Phosphitispora fastidiosa]
MNISGHNTFLLSDTAIIPSIIIIAIFLVFVYIRSKRNLIRDVQKKVLIQNPCLISNITFPARHKRSVSLIAGLTGISGSGILTVAQEGVQYFGYKGREIPLNISIDAARLEAVWLGKVRPLSSRHWLVVGDGSEKHYFTAETSKMFADNQEETKEIYDCICSKVGK